MSPTRTANASGDAGREGRTRAASASRAAILEQILAATSGDADRARAYAELPRPYVRKGSLNAEARLALMMERLREYDAEVIETGPEGIAAAIAVQVKGSGRQKFVAPAGVPAEWLTPGVSWSLDPQGGRAQTTDEIEHMQGVLTAASCGVADSGTIVLHHTEQEGRRVISLLPDWHVCVLRASQVVETLPEYFTRFPEPPKLATYISGPSATADIEMTRIKGVHGPRFLHVVLVRDE